MKSLKRQFKILKSVKPDETKREEFFKLIAEMSADYRTPSFSRRYFAVFSRSVPALVLISALFLAASGAGITFASQNALPGEALYPAKLAIEKIMVATAGNVEKKTELRLEYAGRRLDEVEKIVEQKNEIEEKEVATVLEDYEKKLDDAQKAVSAVQESAKVYERNIAELISRAEEKKMSEKVKERLKRAHERTKEKLKDSDKDENEYEKEDKKENEKESGEIRKENKKEGAKIKQSGKNQNNVTVSNQTIVGLETLSLL